MADRVAQLAALQKAKDAFIKKMAEEVEKNSPLKIYPDLIDNKVEKDNKEEDKEEDVIYVVMEYMHSEVHKEKILEVVYMSKDLQKAKKVYDGIELCEVNNWVTDTKYLIKTGMDVDFHEVEGLINQECLEQESIDPLEINEAGEKSI